MYDILMDNSYINDTIITTTMDMTYILFSIKIKGTILLYNGYIQWVIHIDTFW